ncbi:uncharacterized protein LOC124274649, partial [Haliotis rubra]|uniref:uncharacterized protein LOC124274649 n=1 Tax=Haliotis rubra TaxID=36100 RepID=UPI001EE59CA3
MEDNTAARKFSVPETTLRDRARGRIHPETLKSGTEPILSLGEESRLVEHLKFMSSVGYGYTRLEVTTLASQYAVQLGKRNRDDPFSLLWYYEFMKRWPSLKLDKPHPLEVFRAKATSQEAVSKYFVKLRAVPEKSSTTTLIGCGKALGQQIPPYFVLKGQRLRLDILSGCTPGTNATTSDSGWSTMEICSTYLNDHFLKYAQRSDLSQPILLLYDGYCSHVSLPIIDWAISQNIFLMENREADDSLFRQKEDALHKIKSAAALKRKVLNSIVNGKAITEENTVFKIQEHTQKHPVKKRKQQPAQKKKVSQVRSTLSAKPSTSGLSHVREVVASDSGTDTDNEGDDE